ncbi:MAG: O-acetyl-ADP-ribose deacetylase [Ginsengibacter sp.]
MNTFENKIEVLKGDIVKMHVDAIVNAANSSLLGGGGVDGAIHRAGGNAILEACKRIIAQQGECKTGKAVITSAGNLPASFVIHTVGPIWRGGKNNEEQLLTNCYQNSLQLAIDNDCKTIAFPNISTGIYCFPKEKAAFISVNAVMEYLSTNDKIEKIIFVCFDEENYKWIKKYKSERNE